MDYRILGVYVGVSLFRETTIVRIVGLKMETTV